MLNQPRYYYSIKLNHIDVPLFYTNLFFANALGIMKNLLVLHFSSELHDVNRKHSNMEIVSTSLWKIKLFWGFFVWGH